MINVLIVLIEKEKTNVSKNNNQIDRNSFNLGGSIIGDSSTSGLVYDDRNFYNVVDKNNKISCDISPEKQNQKISEIISFNNFKEMNDVLFKYEQSDNNFFHYNDKCYLCEILYVNDIEYKNINFIFQLYESPNSTFLGENMLNDKVKEELKFSSVKLKVKHYLNSKNV